MIPKEFINTLKEKLDIVEVGKEHLDIQLTRHGAVYKALCPFPDHNERTPSFTIDPSKQNFVCYGGCGRNGDVIELTRELQSLTFYETLKYLTGLTELVLPESNGQQKAKDTTSLLQIIAAARDFYVEQKHSEISRFAQERGLDEEYLRTEWGVGYSTPGKLIAHLKEQGYSQADLIEAGLLKQNVDTGKVYEAFKGRLMWTIYDNLNRPVGFGARRLFEKDPLPAKFINTSTTPLYKKSELFFGLNNSRSGIRKDHLAIICEGYTDVVSFHLAELPNAVSPCGTSVTEQQIKRLSRLLGENGELVVAMDGDEAGINSALKILHLASAYPITLSAVIFPDGTDPDEYRQNHGAQGLQDLFHNRKPLVEELLQYALQQHDLTHPEGVSQAAVDAGEILSNVHNPVLRAEYNKWLSYQLKISRKNIENLYEEKKTTEKVSASIEASRALELNVLRIAYQKPTQFQAYQEILCTRSEMFQTTLIQDALDEILWLDSSVSDGEWKENLLSVLPDKLVPLVKGGLPDILIESEKAALDYLEQFLERLEDNNKRAKKEHQITKTIFNETTNASDVFDQLHKYKEREIA